ncbi:MAG: hypothetical protein A3F17_07605 [Gammaproteobacteria bacterium RIFCSPHIGHO2_12_FULL_41_15]|nr:MAG: hypothetical protein A3F17_07605 [Gammaproteobacteria bacterium RIFCSPHIGHO2_12_FULL_41_15]
MSDIEQQTDQTLKQLRLPKVDWKRPITHEDIAYLLAHYPFLQMVSSGDTPALPEPKLILARSGWVIHLYGEALSCSPGGLLFQGGDFRVLLGEHGMLPTEIINPGKGTVHKQAFDTAQEMVELAKRYSWPGIRIVDGHPSMYFAIWIGAERNGIPIVGGYVPNQEDQRKMALMQRSPEEDQAIRAKPTLG